MPKSIYNMSNFRFQCLISFMLCANLCVTCGIWYVLCSVLYATCPDPFIMYPSCYVACLKPFVACKKSICLLQFNCNKGNKIALSVSIFVASIFLYCICKIIYSCARVYVAFTKLYVALIDSPLDLWWSLLLCYF